MAVTFITKYTPQNGVEVSDFQIRGDWCNWKEQKHGKWVRRSCLLSRIGNYFDVEYIDITEQLNMLDEASRELNEIITY